LKKQQQKARDILRRYVNGQCTEEECAWVEEWYKNNYDSEFKMNPLLAEEHFAEVWDMLEGEITQKKVWPLRKIAAVAAVIAVVLGWFTFYVWRSSPLEPELVQVTEQYDQEQIEAGRNQAILTLADGSTIHLDNVAIGDYVREGDMTIKKMDDGTLSYSVAKSDVLTAENNYNTISTPRGGQYKIILPDNSVVWLNAASSLRFPVAFTGDTRLVELSGEGYFEVAHNKQKPFIVASNNQQTVVKGTKFNMTAYPEDLKITTTLLEGSVLIKNMEPGYTEEMLLKPNEQSVLRHNAIVKTNVAAADIVAWKDGKFVFNNTPLHTIMQQLARWYDVDVDYRTSVEGITFTGSVSRFDDIQDVLRKISLTESVKFERKERRIMVRR
jgi:ferric-dicitrate binding protein FerR (iron transport regulator)